MESDAKLTFIQRKNGQYCGQNKEAMHSFNFFLLFRFDFYLFTSIFSSNYIFCVMRIQFDREMGVMFLWILI